MFTAGSALFIKQMPPRQVAPTAAAYTNERRTGPSRATGGWAGLCWRGCCRTGDRTRPGACGSGRGLLRWWLVARRRWSSSEAGAWAFCRLGGHCALLRLSDLARHRRSPQPLLLLTPRPASKRMCRGALVGCGIPSRSSSPWTSSSLAAGPFESSRVRRSGSPVPAVARRRRVLSSSRLMSRPPTTPTTIAAEYRAQQTAAIASSRTSRRRSRRAERAGGDRVEQNEPAPRVAD